jgi:hypothetical protein
MITLNPFLGNPFEAFNAFNTSTPVVAPSVPSTPTSIATIPVPVATPRRGINLDNIFGFLDNTISTINNVNNSVENIRNPPNTTQPILSSQSPPPAMAMLTPTNIMIGLVGAGVVAVIAKASSNSNSK